MNAREFLVDTVAHIAPANAVDALSIEDAERRIAGANHSIAQLVAHMTFWATWLCDRCDGKAIGMVRHAADGWPDVKAGTWPQIQSSFLAALERVALLGDRADLDAPLTPPIEFPPLAHYTIRDAIVHMAQHTSHHLGQVIVLRQIMGVWPPPSGSWTW